MKQLLLILFKITYKILSRIPGCGLYYVNICEQPIRSSISSKLQPQQKFRFEVVADTAAVENICKRPEWVMRHRQVQNSVCIQAWCQDEVVAWFWYCADEYTDDFMRCRYVLSPKGKCVWDYDVYIKPEYRISRLFAYLWDFAFHHLQQQGITSSFSTIAVLNIASKTAHSRLDTKVVGSIIILEVARVQLMLLSKFPFFYFSRGPGRIKTISLCASSETASAMANKDLHFKN